MNHEERVRRLKAIFTKVIADVAKRRGISMEQAREVFVRALENYRPEDYPLLETGPLPEDYDPADDPSHPMHGWKPEVPP